MPLYLVCAVFLPPPPNLFISLPLSVDKFCLFTIPFFALFVHRSKTIFKCITRTTEYCNQHHLHHTIKYYIFSLLFSSSTRTTPRLCRFSPMCNILSSHLDLSTCTPFLSLSFSLIHWLYITFDFTVSHFIVPARKIPRDGNRVKT